MDRSLADRLADQLDAEHVSRTRFAGLPVRDAEFDEPLAYAIQEGLLARRQSRSRGTIAGYKIGLTTPRMQKLCNGDRPISGVMFAGAIHHSSPGKPARIKVGDFVHLGIESELDMRLARPLDARTRPVTRADVATAIGEVATAFELIEDRHADYATLDWRAMAADNSWHAGLVLAPSIPASAIPDMSNLPGTLEIDRKTVDQGSTADVLGHPLDAVVWLANHLGARGTVIEAGHWASTGSIATIRFPEPGQRFRFTIAGLPPVELEIAQ